MSEAYPYLGIADNDICSVMLSLREIVISVGAFGSRAMYVLFLTEHISEN